MRMKGQERANKLARAIDDLLQGCRPDKLDDEELEELLQIAGIRLEAASSAAHVGAQHEGMVWRQVLDRLQGGEASEPVWGANDPTVAQARWGPFWLRIHPGRSTRLLGSHQPRSGVFEPGGHPWRKLAVAGAVVALFLAAIGPIPATGLADHTAAQFVRFVGEHVGVSETATP